MAAFVAVVDRDGFAAAARHLGLTPPAVTRAVAGLEARLGVRLLNRTTRSLTLTDAGRHYLEGARRVLADVAEAEAHAQTGRLRPAGHLSVTAPQMFGRLHVAPLMSSYLARFPEVTGHLTLSDRWVNLVEEGIDLAVRIGSLPDSGLVARRIGQTRRVVVAAPDYLDRRGVPETPDDLARHDIVHVTSGIGVTGEWRFLRDGAEVRVPVAPRFTTDSNDAALWRVGSGGGLTMVLHYQVVEAVAAGRLRIVLAPFEPPPRPIQIVLPSARLTSAKVRAFVEMAAACDWRF